MKDRLAARLRELGWAGDPDETAADLVARYEEPHRAYHNLAHIGDSLAKLGLVRPLLPPDDALAIELALWWHDAVYDPRASDNEERSAALFTKTAARHLLPEALARKIERLILLTRTHQPGDDLAEQVMTDIDLSILGAAPEAFDAYDRAIRQEYAHVPEQEWRERRRRVLASFVERPRLFVIDVFRAHFERAARQNLRRAIERLRG